MLVLTGTGAMLILINNRLGGYAAHLSTDNISSLPETKMVSDAHFNPCLFIICVAARICFWNIAVYHIFQYWKVIASFCHYNCNKTGFFLLSVSTMAWFSHIMLKVLFFNIIYKECHFISTEYIYIYMYVFFFFVKHFHHIKQGCLQLTVKHKYKIFARKKIGWCVQSIWYSTISFLCVMWVIWFAIKLELLNMLYKKGNKIQWRYSPTGPWPTERPASVSEASANFCG